MRKRTPAGAVIIAASATVAFDATIREAHDRRADVTRYEVESGAPVGGHVRLKPSEIELIVVTTDSPLVELNDATSDRDLYVLRTLTDIFEKRELVTLKCHLGRFEDYVIESISTPVGPDDGASLSPQIKLVEYRQVYSTTIATPDAYLDALVSDTASQSSEPSTGNVSGGVGVEAEPDTSSSSILARIDDSVDGGATNAIASVLESLGFGSAP